MISVWFPCQVDWLNGVFGEGIAYSFGRVNADCWHMYTTSPQPHTGVEKPDQTVELLMTDLDPEVMKHYYKSVSMDGKAATKVGFHTHFDRPLVYFRP